MFGFSEVKYGPIEAAYDLNHNKVCDYKLLEREGYPYYVYEKLDLSGKVTEVYPLFLGSTEESLKVFTGEKPYEGGLNFSCFAYLSWDLKNPPKEVYISKNEQLLKYKGSNLETVYYFFNKEDFDTISIGKEHIDFIKSLDVDFVFISVKNGELYKINTVKTRPEIKKALKNFSLFN